MENDEVCLYSKFGYCKFKEKCKRKHFQQECDNLQDCSRIQDCDKRHPKICKKYGSENVCSFKCDCAYLHKKSAGCKERDLLKDKVASLENTVSELMIKLNIFEDELKKIKKDKVITEQIDIKAQNSEEKDYTSKDAAFKDNNIKKSL